MPGKVYLFLFFDFIVIGIGMKVGFECYKVFKAEKLGFQMKGPIDEKSRLTGEVSIRGSDDD